LRYTFRGGEREEEKNETTIDKKPPRLHHHTPYQEKKNRMTLPTTRQKDRHEHQEAPHALPTC
jgi:hypothetical protein